MNVSKIIEERENPLFNRKEIKIIVSSPINPSISDSEKLLSEKFSQPPENIKIKKIKGRFGSNIFLIAANVYSSIDDKEKAEPKIKIKTKAKHEAEKKPAEEKPAGKAVEKKTADKKE